MIQYDEPLAKYTWYRIGGPAQIFATPKSREDLNQLLKVIREKECRLFILGAGSNLLVSDRGFDGLVIRANRFQTEIRQIAETRVITGGGVMLSALLKKASEAGWSGLEFLAGIPGTVGGAVRMNAGTHLGETSARLKRVTAIDLKSGTEKVFDEMKFAYRKNLFLPEGSLVLEAEWEMTPGDPARVRAVIDETLARRKATQPIDQPSCGSVFKNPAQSGLSAWQVIDRLGLRGHAIGGAQFSPKHSNFIVNTGGASSRDVMGLVELAQTRARAELGVELETEVIVLG